MNDNLVEIEKDPQSGREMLEQLAKTGDFVFHGSPDKLERLEPRQQMHLNEETGKSEPDGEPAVCATISPEVAIFRSLVSSHVAKRAGLKWYWSEFGMRDGKPHFKATPESISQATKSNSIGYVHIFNKKGFDQHDRLEWRAYQEVEPVYVIEVKGSDLPDNIEIIPEPQ